MGVLGYSSPFVPPEWIAAHGLQPRRIVPDTAGGPSPAGMCPFAHAFAACIPSAGIDAAVVTTTCDQMRRVAERIRGAAVFLMNVPATWQTASAYSFYVDELRRLGRFLERLGATPPAAQRLAAVMRDYQMARRALRAAHQRVLARRFAEMVLAIGGGRLGHEQTGVWTAPERSADEESPSLALRAGEESASLALRAGELPPLALRARDARALRARSVGCVPLALVGGPLRRQDLWMLELIEELGASVALDATESGERTLPGVFDERRLDEDPLAELARAYFGSIPDAFRRPDTLLHTYLREECVARAIRGVIFVRYVWCDLWHAELGRLRDCSLPVVEIELDGEQSSIERTRTRIESLVSIAQ